MNFPIPSPDPLPLPAPVWLLQFLSLLTFVLHLVPMSIMLGGSIIAVVALLRKDEELTRCLVPALPVATAMAITLGVAPLLFVQVMYGQFFYSSSILMAVPWLLVVPVLIVAYYGFYFNALTTKPCRIAALVSAAGVVLIGFIYSNNMTLMLTPERWRQFTATANTLGLALNTGEPTLPARSLHMLLGALAVTGLFIAIRGQVKWGALQFALATVANIGAGLWFLFSLPADIRAQFLGGNVVQTAHLGSAVLLALLALMLALLATNSPKPRSKLILASVCLMLTLVLMATIRHFVRQAYLKPHFDLATLPVKPMWDVFALFAVLLVAGLGVVAWMVFTVCRKSSTCPAPASK